MLENNTDIPSSPLRSLRNDRGLSNPHYYGPTSMKEGNYNVVVFKGVEEEGENDTHDVLGVILFDQQQDQSENDRIVDRFFEVALEQHHIIFEDNLPIAKVGVRIKKEEGETNGSGRVFFQPNVDTHNEDLIRTIFKSQGFSIY